MPHGYHHDLYYCDWQMESENVSHRVLCCCGRLLMRNEILSHALCYYDHLRTPSEIVILHDLCYCGRLLTRNEIVSHGLYYCDRWQIEIESHHAPCCYGHWRMENETANHHDPCCFAGGIDHARKTRYFPLGLTVMKLEIRQWPRLCSLWSQIAPRVLRCFAERSGHERRNGHHVGQIYYGIAIHHALATESCSVEDWGSRL